MNEPELVIKPSQWINLGWMIFGILGSFAIIPTIVCIIKMTQTYYTRYEFYERHMLIITGIFTRTTDTAYYGRMKSVNIEEPFFYRIMGLSNLHIVTSEPYLISDITLIGIPVGQTLMEDLMNVIKLERKHNRTNEYEIFNLK